MSKDNVAIAEAYYIAMSKKNVAEMGKYIHSDVEFITPLVKSKGKEAFIEAAKRAVASFNTLTIRAKFGSGDQAMVAYEIDFPAPIGNCPAAALMTFQKGLIAKLELFYDGRLFGKN